MVIHAGKLKQYVNTGGSQLKEDAPRPEKGKQTQASGSADQSRPRVRKRRKNAKKKTEEKVKRQRGMGHFVNHLVIGESYASATPIAFTQQDLSMVRLPYDDPLMIKLQIDSMLVGRVLIDDGSSVDILFLSIFESMGLDRNALRPTC
ncbi:hypothetical protein PanWU01x14_104270 [Parasponia andersonii]|uniref:Aspartic peptidase domain containing protein n=1 Tax=Parasponia andersonii TaxID=3476 RepID=A0A2P5D1T2_PARAD|nr:hypothetical protein PanWU01x14_104270 [Parasponia andersonii]